MASKKVFHVKGGACEAEFQQDKRLKYGEFRWVNDRIYKGV